MKTFTITFHHSNNYGALLQAFALQQTIIGMGHENTVFEYPYNERFYTKLNFGKPLLALKTAYHNFCKLLHKAAITRRENGFADFHKHHMKLSPVYSSMDELRNNPPEADVLITGSDQVWRFSENSEFLPARFLDFGHNVQRKISYAASIESLSYTDEQKESVKRWLSDFYRISLREQSAADYIASFTGLETRRVLDPVFLLTKEQWSKIAKPRPVEGPYILCYQVQNTPGMQEVVDTLKKRTGYRTVAVLPYSTKWIRTDESLFDVSPEEFLYLYEKAAVVVSASFHGTSLGLVFNKPVYAVTKPGSAGRIKDITDLFGIQAFCLDASSRIPDVSEYNTDAATQKLNREREASLAFLSNCLT